MSWQEYIDSSLLGTGSIVRAAIIGHNGDIWAISNGFNLATNECAALVKAFSGDASDLQQHGLVLANEKYILLRNDERSVYVRRGGIGACCVKTGQCIIVGIYDTSSVAAGEATKVVEDLADYLISVGY